MEKALYGYHFVVPPNLPIYLFTGNKYSVILACLINVVYNEKEKKYVCKSKCVESFH